MNSKNNTTLSIDLRSKKMTVKGKDSEKLMSLLSSLIYALTETYTKRGRKTKLHFQIEFIKMILGHVTYFIEKGEVSTPNEITFKGKIDISDNKVYFDAVGTKADKAYMVAILYYSILRQTGISPDSMLIKAKTYSRSMQKLLKGVPTASPTSPAPVKSFQFKKEEADNLRHKGKATHSIDIYSHEDCSAKTKMMDGYAVVSYIDRVEGTSIPDVTSRFRIGDIIAVREKFFKSSDGKLHMYSEYPEDERKKHKWENGSCRGGLANLKGEVVSISCVKGRYPNSLCMVYSFIKAS